MAEENQFLQVVLFPPQEYCSTCTRAQAHPPTSTHTDEMGGVNYKKRVPDSGNSDCHSAVFWPPETTEKLGYHSIFMPLKARASPYLLTTPCITYHLLQLCNHHHKLTSEHLQLRDKNNPEEATLFSTSCSQLHAATDYFPVPEHCHVLHSSCDCSKHGINGWLLLLHSILLRELLCCSTSRISIT